MPAEGHEIFKNEDAELGRKWSPKYGNRTARNLTSLTNRSSNVKVIERRDSTIGDQSALNDDIRIQANEGEFKRLDHLLSDHMKLQNILNFEILKLLNHIQPNKALDQVLVRKNENKSSQQISQNMQVGAV